MHKEEQSLVNPAAQLIVHSDSQIQYSTVTPL